MTENMKKYLELLSKDEEAQKKLNEQKSTAIEEATKKIIADAAERGITLTEEDFAEDAETGELSEDELEAVAGSKFCYCAFGGGGTATHRSEKTCACAVFGFGMSETEEGKGDVRCNCNFGGYGIEISTPQS